jgi:hypothetical protein
MAVEAESHAPSEFWTVVTDFMLSAVCAALALRLHNHVSSFSTLKKSPISSESRAPPAAAGVLAARWGAGVLWASCASSLLGGLFHALSEQHTAAAVYLWNAVLITLHLTGFCLCRALACLCSPSRAKVIEVFALAKILIGIIVTVFIHTEILIPMMDYIFALVLWAAYALCNMSRPWALYMVATISLTVASSLIQFLQIKPSQSFNHNDLFHIIQVFSMIFFYKSCHSMGSGHQPKSPGKSSSKLS